MLVGTWDSDGEVPVGVALSLGDGEGTGSAVKMGDAEGDAVGGADGGVDGGGLVKALGALVTATLGEATPVEPAVATGSMPMQPLSTAPVERAIRILRPASRLTSRIVRRRRGRLRLSPPFASPPPP